MMTNTKMTIYNKYIEPFTHNKVYKKHIIDNVFWDDARGINRNTGYENSDEVNIYIPFDKNDLTDYKEPKQYSGIGWTLENGDFILKGECELKEINGIKDLSGYEVFEITLVDVKDFGSSNMQHFEIRGK